ncbi:MAG: AI-2E family transporter [Rhodospirillales bacterium]|nr:AI-2E family transporter [Rhodospirillales bacterium]
MSPSRVALFWAFIAALFFVVIRVLGDILFPFVLGIVIAYLFDPVANRLVLRGVPRWGAASIIMGVFFFVLAGAAAFIGPMLFHEAVRFIEDFPELVDRAQTALIPYAEKVKALTGAPDAQKIRDTLGNHAGGALALGGNVLAGIQAGGQAVAGFVSVLVVAPVVAFFMIREWPDIKNRVQNLLPRRHEATILKLLGQIDVRLAGFIRGQLMVCAVLGILYGVALSIAGLEYGLVIGLGAGILSIIPLVGSTAGLLTGVIVAWVQSGEISYVALIAGIFAAGQFVEGNFLTPRLVGQSVGLHPLWILLALMAGGSLLGLTGMLIAVPVAVIVAVLAGFALDLYKDSAFYAAPGAERENRTEDIP